MDERVEIDFPPEIFDRYLAAVKRGEYDRNAVQGLADSIDPSIKDPTYILRFRRSIEILDRMLEEFSVLKARLVPEGYFYRDDLRNSGGEKPG